MYPNYVESDYDTLFKDCIFDNVDFTGATIDDIHFQNCYFNNCTFIQINIGDYGCSFEGSTFVGTHNSDGSLTTTGRVKDPIGNSTWIDYSDYPPIPLIQTQ